jgi:hypothetical protein
MKALFYISTLFVFVLFSCTKIGRNVTIKGKVVNPVTNEPIEGIEAWFQKSTNGLPGGYKTIKEEITDVNGEFEINASRAGTHYIRLGDVKGNYRLGWYENGAYTGTSVKEVDKGKVMEVEYHLVPYGDIKVNIYNVNCQGLSDTLILERNYQEKQVGFYQPITLTGCYSVEGNPTKVPIGNYEIKWTVNRGGTTEVFSDNLFVPENGVGEMTINY